ncbi:hypothetical protein L210DRAFT_3506481 [Boletus edulis BED1]|uniref:Uncharacterized protein n=1 Tax=Boletus edulis BED1 TaxID=1328754 RepID=A0AAD4BN22_BOLED|nr:hypothetical protein L210DRAFT_3506481 [Boletus edulis BED1]
MHLAPSFSGGNGVVGAGLAIVQVPRLQYQAFLNFIFYARLAKPASRRQDPFHSHKRTSKLCAFTRGDPGIVSQAPLGKAHFEQANTGVSVKTALESPKTFRWH